MERIIGLVLATVLLAAGGLPAAGQSAAPASSGSGGAAGFNLTLPLEEGSVRLAVIGDTGTGGDKQAQLGELLYRSRQVYPFEFVLMLGDNLYGSERPADYRAKFEQIYKPLLSLGVKFYASLGNHDEVLQKNYEHFNMEGKEYYRFEAGNASFYALNSNYMDKKQVEWLESELSKDDSRWKVCFFHHPPYSSGRAHGSDRELREIVEPIFVKHGVNAVFAGHEHFYERLKPQKGIYYFISGSGGKLRRGDVERDSPLTAKAYDEDMSFMLVEIAGDELHFQVLARDGKTVDSGMLEHQSRAPVGSPTT